MKYYEKNKSNKSSIIESISSSLHQFYSRFRMKELSSGNLENNKIKDEIKNTFGVTKETAEAILREFSLTLLDQSELYNKLDSIRNLGTSQTIYDVFFDDFISSNKGSEIFTAKYQGSENEETLEIINKRINKTISRLKLRKFIKTIAKDFMHKGNYYLKPLYKDGKGIIALHDNVDPSTIIPLFRGMDRLGFINVKKESEILAKHDLIHFNLDSDGVIKIKKDDFNFDGEIIDEHIRLGKGLLVSSITEIKELELYKTSMIAQDLKELLSPVFIQLQMSDKTTWEEGLKNIKNYKSFFSDAMRNLGSSMQSARELLKTAIRFEVLPSFGSGKGTVTTLDINKNRETAIERLKTLKKELASQIGIPAFHLLGAEDSTQTNEHKLATMKINTRYLHKGLGIQAGIADGIRDILFLDLRYSGINVEYENIIVSMAEIINVELIDNLEFLIGVLEAEERFFNFITTLDSSSLGIGINSKEYFNRLKQVFGAISGMENIFTLKENKEQNSNEELRKIQEIFIPSKGEYQNRLGNMGKAINQKIAWKVNRFNYMKGIKKFHRLDKLSKIKKQIKEILDSSKKNINEKILLNLDEFNKEFILQSIKEIKSEVSFDYENTPIHEDKKDYKFFIEKLFSSLNDLENHILLESFIDIDNYSFISENFTTDFNIENVA